MYQSVHVLDHPHNVSEDRHGSRVQRRHAFYIFYINESFFFTS